MNPPLYDVMFHLRVGSANCKLKQMLENGKCHMCKCWESMHDNMKLHLSNIQASFKKKFL